MGSRVRNFYPKKPAQQQRLFQRILNLAWCKFEYNAFQIANSKGADQTAHICRLLCHMQESQVFSG